MTLLQTILILWDNSVAEKTWFWTRIYLFFQKTRLYMRVSVVGVIAVSGTMNWFIASLPVGDNVEWSYKLNEGFYKHSLKHTKKCHYLIAGWMHL